MKQNMHFLIHRPSAIVAIVVLAETVCFGQSRIGVDDEIAICQILVESEPESAEYLCRLADAYTRKYAENRGSDGRWKFLLHAKNAANQALAVAPKSALPRLSLARLYEAQEKPRQAAGYANEALELDPDDETAKSLLTRLKGQSGEAGENQSLAETGGPDAPDPRPDPDGSRHDTLLPPHQPATTGPLPNWVDDGSACWSFREGSYFFTGKQRDGLRHAHFGFPMQNCVVEMDVRKLAGDTKKSKWGYGLYVRSDGQQRNYYEFIIQAGGQFQIGKGIDGRFGKLSAFSRSAALKTGHDQWNSLKLSALGNELSFYANGQLLKSVRDDSIRSGKIGLFAVDAYDSVAPDTIEFRNIRVMKPR